MPFIGKTPETGAFRLIDSITTSATDTYALTVQGDHYFPESARNLIVSLNGVTQAPETAYTVSGSHIVFASALTSSDVIDYILVIGDAVDIGTPSDGTVGDAQLKASLDLSGKTLTLANDQISGDVIHGGTISNFASTGIDDNATSTAITIDSAGRVGIGSSPDTNMMLHVHKSDTNRLYLTSTNNAIQIIGDPGLTGMFIDNESDAASNISFRNTSSYSERMRILGTGDIGYSGKLFSSNSLTSAGGLQLYRDHATGSCYLFDTTTAPYDGPLIFGTGNAERMRVDADGIVKLITANDTAGTTKRLTFGTNAFNRAEIRCTNAATYDGSLEFHTGNSSNYLERMRLDASGNLLFNTTNTLTSAELSAGETGIALRSGDLLIVSREAGAGVLVNRKTSDGDLIEFRKDGTTIGSIGNHTNKLEITGSGSNTVTFGHSQSTTVGAGIYSWHTNNALVPYNSAGHSIPDGVQSLGHGSYRWKDLYLSGGAYLGGTGSANYLDDYEEGTWTPAITGTAGIPSVTYSHRSGYYIKTGNTVIARWGMRVSAISGGSGQWRVTGLPYTGKSYGSYQQPACFSNTQGLTTDADGPVLFYVEDGQSTMQGRIMNNSDTPLPLSYSQAGSWCVGTIIYDVT